MNNTLKGMTMAGLGFSSCQKNVLLGPIDEAFLERLSNVSVVVRRMYYWDLNWIGMMLFDRKVSVVVRRMYYWDPN